MFNHINIKSFFTLFIIPAFLLSAEAATADQQNYDKRQEQTLRAHDFDVKHYRISLSLDETTRSFDGETAITFSSTIDALHEITLDAKNFSVRHVENIGGYDLKYSHSDDSLTISLSQALAKNEETTITISYGATDLQPNVNVGIDFRDKTDTNPQLISSLNWPNGARHWFPSFDHPSDWATHETIITVNEAFTVVANGAPVSDTASPATHQKIFHWSQSKPQPTYLYAFAAGPYSVVHDTYRALPLHYWVYPGDEDVAKSAFGATPQIIAYFEDLYGTKFPWVKYDQIIVPGIGGGAESTSATLMGKRIITYERKGEKGASDWLIAHELAHQWWGDMIGYKDWGHNWMAESFATHGEYLYTAHALGDDEGALYLNDYKETYLTQAKTKFIRPIVTHKWDIPNDMFDSHAYPKGAVVLNMFRELVGHETFGAILQSFLKKHAYSPVTTDNFFETVKNVAQKDYHWFFDQWLLKPGHPSLDVSYDWNADKKLVSMTIKQKQDTGKGIPIYRLPIKVGITTKAGKQVETVWLNKAQHTFTFDVAEKPLLVHFDEGDLLLKEWTFDKPVTELLYQLKHDSVMGRLWAVGELEKHKNVSGVLAALKETANNDPVKAVREKAARIGSSGDSPN